jgi:hypothetical protein
VNVIEINMVARKRIKSNVIKRKRTSTNKTRNKSKSKNQNDTTNTTNTINTTNTTNTTTVILYPKTTVNSKSLNKQVSTETVAKDVKKAVKGAQNEEPSTELQKSMEHKIKIEIENRAADLAVFKSVAEHMFVDPHFRALIADRYGVHLGRALGIYFRTVGFILEAIFGVWLIVAGPINLSMKITSFIFHIVFYACIMSVRWLNGVGYIPEWLSKRLRQTRIASKKSRTTSSDFKVVK